MKPSKLSKQSLINKLLEYAFLSMVPSRYRAGEVGKGILKLSEKEREVCKTLTSEDFNHRIK